MVDHSLKESRVISAHQAMVTMISVNNSRVFTVGDDFTLRVW